MWIGFTIFVVNLKTVLIALLNHFVNMMMRMIDARSILNMRMTLHMGNLKILTRLSCRKKVCDFTRNIRNAKVLLYAKLIRLLLELIIL